MVPRGHEQALETVRARLTGTTFSWAVSGSVALALHGLQVECGDLDLLTTAGAAPRLAALLAGDPLEPVRQRERGALRGRIGRLRLDSIEVEILGDVRNRLPDGSWSDPPRLRDFVRPIELGGRPCPVLTLAALRTAYVASGRPERVALIDAAERESGRLRDQR